MFALFAGLNAALLFNKDLTLSMATSSVASNDCLYGLSCVPYLSPFNIVCKLSHIHLTLNICLQIIYTYHITIRNEGRYPEVCQMLQGAVQTNYG